jgi:hypothetical protein
VIYPENPIQDNGAGGGKNAPYVNLPRGDPNGPLSGNTILDANGNSLGSQTTPALMTHELQHEFDHNHPEGRKPRSEEFKEGSEYFPFYSESEKSAVDAENKLREHCPEAGAGPKRERYR